MAGIGADAHTCVVDWVEVGEGVIFRSRKRVSICHIGYDHFEKYSVCDHDDPFLTSSFDVFQ